MGSSASISSSSSSSSNSHGVIGIKEIYNMLKNEKELKDIFIQFITKKYQNNLTFLLIPFDLTIEYEKQLKDKAINLINNIYNKPEKSTVNIINKLNESIENNNNLTNISLNDINYMKKIYQNRKQIITLLTINSFSSFLKSDEYQRWFWTRESPIPIETPFQSIFADFRSDEFEPIISKDSWLQTICHCLDNLPISISIADATQRRFPLIYVNQKFQDQHGFTLQEVIGKSNKFLQGGMVEESMATIMTQQLGSGQVCRVLVSNKTKDEREFCNYLSMKPIHSLDGVYRFIIAVQYDITTEDSSYISFCIANDLFEALPSTCPNDAVGSVRNALSPEF